MGFLKHFIGLSLVLTGATLASATALAAEVKITSFVYTGPNTRTAEICGKVQGEMAPLEIVEVTADPRRNPGKYSVLVSTNGQFCVVISTSMGEAEARLRTQSQKISARIQ